MDSNIHSTQGPVESAGQQSTRPPTPPPDDLAELTALLDRMAARDLERLPDAVRAERVQGLRPLADRLEGQWLKELAGVDAHGAAGPRRGCSSAPPPAGCGPGCG